MLRARQTAEAKEGAHLAAAAIYPRGEFYVHGPAPTGATGKANYSTLLQGLMLHGRFVRMGVWLKGTIGIPRIDDLVP